MSTNANLIAVAQAVTESLAEAALGMPVEIERTYVARYELKNEEGCQIFVIPADVDEEPISKAGDDLTCKIAVIVVSKVLPETMVAQVDALMLLMDDICVWLRGRDLTAMPEANWDATENKPACDLQRLKVSNVFASMVTVTYMVQR